MYAENPLTEVPDSDQYSSDTGEDGNENTGNGTDEGVQAGYDG